MNVAAFLGELRRLDVKVREEDGQLRCNAAPGVLTPALVARLREHKGEIMSFLRGAGQRAAQQRAIVPLQPSGARTPVFAVAGHNGDVFAYRTLAAQLGPEQPFYGLQPPGLDGRSAPLTRLEDLAAWFAAQVSAFHPAGPLVVGGYCAGGAIAFELARQLTAAGREIPFVALFGAPYPKFFRPSWQLKWRSLHKLDRMGMHGRALAARSWGARAAYLRALNAARRQAPEPVADPVLQLRDNVERVTLAAVQQYEPQRFEGRLCMFLPCARWRDSGYFVHRWHAHAPRVDEYYGPDGTNTDTMLQEPAAGAIRVLFELCSEEAERASDAAMPALLPRRATA